MLAFSLEVMPATVVFLAVPEVLRYLCARHHERVGGHMRMMVRCDGHDTHGVELH